MFVYNDISGNQILKLIHSYTWSLPTFYFSIMPLHNHHICFRLRKRGKLGHFWWSLRKEYKNKHLQKTNYGRFVVYLGICLVNMGNKSTVHIIVARRFFYLVFIYLWYDLIKTNVYHKGQFVLPFPNDAADAL